jgi:SAM-dependent methyltransferase
MTDDHVLANRANWDADAPNWIERGRRSWQGEPSWGIWSVPEADLGVLPDVDGADAVELGCGTGYVSAWLARRRARPVGLDNSFQQLSTAKALQDEFGLPFPLIHGNAERTPFREERFDLAISEYGAAIWCDPHVWIPEAARILRPGGRLIFLGHSPIMMLTYPHGDDDAPASETLHRDYFGMKRFEWDEAAMPAIEFVLPHGEMIRLLRESWFEVEDLIEIRAPTDAVTPSDPLATADWARRWPSEEVWKARRTR